MFTFRNIQKFCVKKIDTEVLLQKLQSKPLITLTRDNYQINMGLLIQRDIIFLHNTDEEMKMRKFRYQLSKRNNLIPKLSKELHEFTHHQQDVDVFGDNQSTHVKLVGDQRTVFAENSKFWKNVDPEEKNNKSIQYNSLHTIYLLVKQNGQWQFPTINIENKQTFKQAQDKLFTQMTNNTWEAYFFQRMPRLVTIDESEDKNQKIKGIKTFYFLAKHYKGKVNIQGYEDWAWASRPEMNKFLNEKTYNQVIHALDL